jgi:asparagine synthase (glutamine-hydrolysing)
MCGIVGFYSPKNIFTADELKHMTDSLIHRGPDARGLFMQDTVGMGHRRLSIIDLSEQANQPMFSQSGESVIVFNGEIYNYKELSKELGLVPKTSSDTEVLVEAFEKWGPNFVSKLNGMFAMAIYQIKTNKLYLYRDRIGIKPLFYYLNNKQLAFASELKAFAQLAHFKQQKQINKIAVHQFLNLGYIPAPHTIYQNTFKFPKASYAVFDGEKLEFTTYWSPEKSIQKTVLTNFNEAKSQLANLLHSAVKYRLIADVPYGTFLSGGVDSSLVTAVAQKVSNTQLKTFSIGFAEQKFNESGYAQKVAQHLETEHHAFILTEKDAKDRIPDLFATYDEPFADSSAIPTMLVSKMARSKVTMTLSGDGGDELFDGYGMYNWAERLNNPMVHHMRFFAKTSLKIFGNRYQRIAKMFDYQTSDNLQQHIFSQEQYFFSSKELDNLMTPEYNFLAEHEIENPFNRSLNARELQAFFDLNHYLPDDLLVKVDRASMRYSLEDRVPLLDHRIVEFALNLDPKLKVHQGIQKYLLKELVYDYVPKAIFDRPKWGFSIPLNKWLKTDLAYLSHHYLAKDKIINAGFVDYPQVKNLLDAYYKKNKDWLYNRVWALICLHQWYFDGFKE